MLPVIRSDPPLAASYQLYVPPGAVALSVAAVFIHTFVPGAVGAAGVGLTVIVYVLGVPVQPLT